MKRCKRKPYQRSAHVPTIYEMRATAMESAARTRNPEKRAIFVGMAREINRVLIYSDRRRRANFDEFRAVLASLE